MGELFAAPCDHAVEVVDFVLVGSREGAVLERSPVPFVQRIAELAVGRVQGLVSGAAQAEVAEIGAIERVGVGHERGRFSGRCGTGAAVWRCRGQDA